MLLFLITFIKIVFSVVVPQQFLDPNLSSNTYAVLVAGAKSWENYWSQAQVCAAYQQLHAAGVPDERIILWLYDDVAHDIRNPHRGHLYLYKGGPDVYAGIIKDLVGKEITPQNFLKLLRGENMTIGSKKNTCHSGSMFNGLIDPTMNIYAATSVDPLNVAWLCDCHDAPIIHYCQSNCWAKYYVLDTENAMHVGTFKNRTFEEQYFKIRNQTWTLKDQTACRYGNMDISRNNALYMFQGTGEDSNAAVLKNKQVKRENAIKMTEFKLHKLKSRFEKYRTEEFRKEYEDYLLYMENIDEKWKKFAKELEISIPNDEPVDCYPSPIKPICMKRSVTLAKYYCGKFDEYSLQYLTYINQACQEGKNINEIEKSLKIVCG